MPSRIYSRFPERKITNPAPAKKGAAGSSPAINERTANWAGLPGKASNWYGKKGPVVKTYPSSQGLC